MRYPVYNEFCDEIKNKSDDEIITIINTASYYTIFSDYVHMHEHIPATIISTISEHAIKYIVLSRKLVIFSRLIMKKIISSLQTLNDINRFFSWYTHDEIIKILCYNTCGCTYYYRDNLVYYTFIYSCMKGVNELLLNYGLDYLQINDISTIVPAPLFMISMMTKHNIDNMYDNGLLMHHEQLLQLFSESLRATWIKSCIIYS